MDARERGERSPAASALGGGDPQRRGDANLRVPLELREGSPAAVPREATARAALDARATPGRLLSDRDASARVRRGECECVPVAEAADASARLRAVQFSARVASERVGRRASGDSGAGAAREARAHRQHEAPAAESELQRRPPADRSGHSASRKAHANRRPNDGFCIRGARAAGPLRSSESN